MPQERSMPAACPNRPKKDGEAGGKRTPHYQHAPSSSGRRAKSKNALRRSGSTSRTAGTPSRDTDGKKRVEKKGCRQSRVSAEYRMSELKSMKVGELKKVMAESDIAWDAGSVVEKEDLISVLLKSDRVKIVPAARKEGGTAAKVSNAPAHHKKASVKAAKVSDTPSHHEKSSVKRDLKRDLKARAESILELQAKNERYQAQNRSLRNTLKAAQSLMDQMESYSEEERAKRESDHEVLKELCAKLQREKMVNTIHTAKTKKEIGELKKEVSLLQTELNQLLEEKKRASSRESDKNDAKAEEEASDAAEESGQVTSELNASSGDRGSSEQAQSGDAYREKLQLQMDLAALAGENVTLKNDIERLLQRVKNVESVRSTIKVCTEALSCEASIFSA